MKVLIIEDEPSLREIIVGTLVKEHYTAETATTVAEAQEKLGVYDYDCILLDIMLPDGNGLEVLKQLKAMRKTECVIILSAKDSIDDKVAGLELGADDYLPKPFHLAELTARIRSVIRRKHHDGAVVIEVGNVKIQPDRNAVSVDNTPLVLGRKEYDILLYFATRPGHMITKENLAEAVWGDLIDQCDNFDFIYAHLKNLRRKLEEAHAQILFKTIYGFGYKMEVKQ